MLKIGLLSDTHGYLDPGIFKYLDTCDEIWHAGDIGTVEITDKLSSLKPLRAVYGNIDGGILRKQFKQYLLFTLEGVSVLITHIGGAAGSYTPYSLELISKHKPKLFICGHSHILKVMYDNKNELLYMNPGAAGNQGFHKIKTLLRFELINGNIKNLEAIELGHR